MRLISFLKAHLEGFPLITQVAIKKLNKDALRLKRLSKFSTDDLVEADTLWLAALSGVESLLAEMSIAVFKASGASTIGLVLADCKGATVRDWADFWNEALCYERDPLHFLISISIDKPVEFAGLMISLLEQGVAAEEMIQSRLLHRFFIENCTDMEVVRAAYTLLATERHAQLQDLLSIIPCLSAECEGQTGSYFETFSVSGVVATDLISQTLPESSFSCTGIEENLRHLYQFFGEDFFINLLYLGLNDAAYQPFIMSVLQDMSLQSFEALFKDLATKVPEEVRGALFDGLSRMLTEEQLTHLLRPGLYWIILAVNPVLLEKMDLVDFLRDPISSQDFKYAASLVSEPLLSIHKTRLHQLLLERLLLNPELLTDELALLAQSMRMHTETALLSKNALILIQKELVMLAQQVPFGKEEYGTLYDHYSRHKQTIVMLQQLQVTPCGPKTNYELHSLILREQFQRGTPLRDCLYVMHPHNPTYSVEERQRAQSRTLMECLARESHQSLQEAIETELQKAPFYSRTTVPDDFFENVVLYGNVTWIQRRLSSDSEERRQVLFESLEAAARQLSKKSLLSWLLPQPTLLAAILPFYPDLELMLITSDLLLEAISDHPLGFKTIVQALTQEQIRSILNTSCFECTIFQRVVEKPGGYPMLRELLPIELFSAFQNGTSLEVREEEDWGASLSEDEVICCPR